MKISVIAYLVPFVENAFYKFVVVVSPASADEKGAVNAVVGESVEDTFGILSRYSFP